MTWKHRTAADRRRTTAGRRSAARRLAARRLAARRTTAGRLGRDRGSFAIEAAILVPFVLGFALMAVAAGRIQTTAAEVDAAARSGARAASMARTPEGADRAARDAVEQALADRHVRCTREPFDGPEYTPPDPQNGTGLGSYTVRVSCTVSYADLLRLDGAWGSKTFIGTFVSVQDRYRAN